MDPAQVRVGPGANPDINQSQTSTSLRQDTVSRQEAVSSRHVQNKLAAQLKRRLSLNLASLARQKRCLLALDSPSYANQITVLHNDLP
ncbi:hypothetical protein BM1_07366 [Bipolaris maydis]|nr:hypothetical protein BM1_07366 [Bipolaris maydis]